MDTLFRLVNLQQYYNYQEQQQQQSDQSFTSTTTTSSRSSSHYPSAAAAAAVYESHPYSSSKHPSPPHQNYYPTLPPPQPVVPHVDETVPFDFSRPEWAGPVLLDAARAIATGDSQRLNHVMWVLNEVASPYGDRDQKLASYFLQAIFSRMTDSGRRSLRSISSASDRSSSFDSTRKLLLKFQEVSPWTTFGHVSSNGAILESIGTHPKIHVIDFSNTFCTQWPTFLESLATRADVVDTPHLRLTTVAAASGGGAARVMKEISARMEKFARLMGVPFKFEVIHHSGDLSELDFGKLGVRDDEAVAINCVGSLRSVSPMLNRRDYVVSRFKSLRPRIVTVVEEEADFDAGGDFVKGFEEWLRWFRVYMECLEESFPRTSNERLMLERRAGRAILDLVACPVEESTERRETAERWSEKFGRSGFGGVGFSEEVCDDVKALLRRYKDGWSMRQNDGGGEGMFLCWKEQPVVWASAWRPADD
ncbi:Protein SHORT-ROOT [Linum grandiflorum]